MAGAHASKRNEWIHQEMLLSSLVIVEFLGAVVSWQAHTAYSSPRSLLTRQKLLETDRNISIAIIIIPLKHIRHPS